MKKQSKKKALISASLGAAFIAAAWNPVRDMRTDHAQRRDHTAALIENSVSYCPQENGDTQYTARLNGILRDVPTDSLAILRNRDVTICLDRRLAEQKKLFFGQQIEGALYRGDNSNTPIVTVWDNGQNESRMLYRDIYDLGAETVGSIANTLPTAKANAAYGTLFAYKYEECKEHAIARFLFNEQSCKNKIRWKPANDFHAYAVEQNPALQNPPQRKKQPTVKIN
ncbi:MAG: hypothetical protein OXT65_01065 [Alphaproteobacteria bacterium]|nr:hypothetical protein [Alphaproteobacteria bacterium]